MKWSPSPVDCPELAGKLECHFDRMAHQFDSWNRNSDGSLEGLALGGGYGRGEGGVLYDPRGDTRPYNDLDYFLFTRRKLTRLESKRLCELEARESEILKVDVEVKDLPLSALSRASESMMFYDLVAGHRIVWGKPDLLAPFSEKLDPSQIGLEEATHLLWNRGSGLYLARCRIAEEKNPDFVIRNHHKASLAMGDALLTADGLYHVSILERRRRLECRDWYRDHVEGLDRDYPAAVEAKFRPLPEPAGWKSLRCRNEELTARWSGLFLELESQRLGTRFSSLAEYAKFKGRLIRSVPLWKAPLFAVRDRMRHGAFLHPVFDYPRGSLFRALARLNDLRGPIEPDCPIARFLPAESPLPESRLEWESIYTSWWERYS